MDVIALIARVVFALIFLGSGVGHLTAAKQMAGFVESKQLPRPVLMVRLSGGYLLVAGVLLVLGVWADLAALAIAVFLLAAAFLFHDFWAQSDPQARQNDQAHFLKNVSLAGGALALFVLYASDPRPGLTLVGPLF